mgnify:CR=1 FL=1
MVVQLTPNFYEIYLLRSSDASRTVRGATEINEEEKKTRNKQEPKRDGGGDQEPNGRNNKTK